MQRGSYMLIEPGMSVRGTDADLGTVSDVVADTGVDVFRGIVVSHGFLQKQSFIAADHVVSVDENMVQVDISKSEADNLPQAMSGAGVNNIKG